MENDGYENSLDGKTAWKAMLMHSNAYDDYLAARVLINSKLYRQGVMLSSSAIEKHLKVFLIAMQVKYDYFHLDDLKKAQKYFNGTAYETILSFIDPVFLDIVSRTYRWRYHDNIKAPEGLGFFVNQFLGELDFLFGRMSSMIHFSTDQDLKPLYKREVEAGRKELFENNYFLAGMDKKQFMTQPSMGCAMYYDPAIVSCLHFGTKEEIVPIYNGQLATIDVTTGANSTVTVFIPNK